MVRRRAVDSHPPAYCLHPQNERGGSFTREWVHPKKLFLNLVAGQTKLFFYLFDKRLPRGKRPANLLPPAAPQDIWPQYFDVFLLELPIERGKGGVEGT
jgi:hypothetical protein